jgi:hypothetical protein
MVPIHFTAGTGTPVWTQVGTFTEFWGFVGTNAEAYFLKLYWQGNAVALPVVGVTVPSITIPVPANPSAVTSITLERGLVQSGPMYYTVTKNAPDTDATALATGGDVITLLVE